MNRLLTWILSWFRRPDDNAVLDVQAAAVKACGFLPAASSVAEIIAAGNPAVTSAVAIATMICKAVTASVPQSFVGITQQSPAPPLIVNGIYIKGRFVK